MKIYVILLVFLCAIIITVSGSVSAAEVPSAHFKSNVTNGCAPLSVQFTDTSMGNPTSWYWDFGDGHKSADRNPTHTYQATGNYTVSLNVNNEAGNNIDTKNNYIQVNPPAPVADFETKQTMCYAPLYVEFKDLSQGKIDSYEWDFGDGTVHSTDSNPNHTYMQPGSYTVTLTVKGPGGSNTKVKEDYIMVSDANPPVPKANLASGLYNHTLTVILTATDDDPNTTITFYYTLDGTDPTWNILPGSNSTRIFYQGPITISKEGINILKFIAADSLAHVSDIFTKTYTIDKTASKATVSLKSGSYNTNKKVTIKLNEKGNIYYTLNGSTPTKTSEKYNGVINITYSCKLKFLAVDLAGNKSPVYTVNYTIDKTAPKLISTSHKNNLIISRNSTFWFKFSENIKSSVNWSKIYFKNLKTGKKIAVTKTIKNNTLYLKTSNKSASTWYQIYIPESSVKDAAGNNLARGFIYTFQTGKN